MVKMKAHLVDEKKALRMHEWSAADVGETKNYEMVLFTLPYHDCNIVE